MIHVLLLVSREIFDKALEWLSCLSLRWLRTSTKELGNTILKDLIDEILLTKCFFLFCVLSNDGHYFRKTVGIVDSHCNSSKWLCFVKQKIDMGSHLLFFFALKGHNGLFLCFELFIISWRRSFEEKHIVDSLRSHVSQLICNTVGNTAISKILVARYLYTI